MKISGADEVVNLGPERDSDEIKINRSSDTRDLVAERAHSRLCQRAWKASKEGRLLFANLLSELNGWRNVPH